MIDTVLVAAAAAVAPSVASISVVGTRLVEAPLSYFMPFFTVPRIEEITSLGTGFVVDPRGYLITNAHVVKGAKKITATFPDGSSYEARLVYASDKLDLALLKVDARLPAVRFANSDSLRPGQRVIALGNPVGFLLEDLEPTVTAGVISGLHRTVLGYRDVIQTDAAINPGNSGGPLVDELGRVVGVNTFIVSKSGGFEGIGFAIPSNTVQKFVREVLNHGKLREAYLGVAVQELTLEIAEALGFKGKGVLVTSAEPGSPLEPGDVITEAQGRPVRIMGDWEDATYFLVPDDTIRVKFFRKGKFREAVLVAKEVRVEARPTALGAEVSPITPGLKEKFGLEESSGVVVVKVKRGSLAQAVGLKPGDVILWVNGIEPKTPEDIDKALRARPGALDMVISRRGRKIRLSYRF